MTNFLVGLRLGGVDFAFKLKIGDILILDTGELSHSSFHGYQDGGCFEC